MIDLDAIDKDPWPTWPVDKNELRGLVDEIHRLRAALREIEDCDLDPRLSRQSCVEQLQSMARAALEGVKSDD